MNRRQTVFAALYACLFALCTAMGRRITFGGDVWMKNTETYIRPLAAGDILVFFVLAFIVGFALLVVHRNGTRIRSICLTPKMRNRPLRFAALCALALLLVWLPYILTVAPGNIYVDSLSSISQMLERGHPTSNHHPMFYTLLVGVFLKIGNVVFGSANIGVLLYSLFQTAVMILCIVSVLTLMYHKKVSGWLVGASLAYFMLVPLFPSYAMSMWKDALFSCMLLCLSIVLFFLVSGRARGWWWFLCYGAAGLGAMIFRNNGMYVFVGVTVLALWPMRRQILRFACVSICALALYIASTTLATRVWNIYSDYVENVGIPLLQMGYTINHDGDFSEEEKEYLFRLMPEEVWNYAYRPCLVDGIKWNPQFDLDFLDETKGEFFKAWAGGLVKNLDEYVDAYLLATHGFWQPGVQNLYGFMDVQMNENPYGIEFMDLFEKIFGFSIMPILKDYPIFLGSGTLLWLVLLGMTLVCTKKMKYALVYMPAMLNWATVMVATPVAYSLRYVFIFALGLPLYLALALMMDEEKENPPER